MSDAAMDEQAIVELVDALLHTRRHIAFRHLDGPAPDEATLRALFAAAAAAPDHRRLRPWRFVVVQSDAGRETLARAFADALRARDPEATEAQLEDARAKAFRGPALILAIADLRADVAEVAPFERVVSLGCAIQNLLLAASARGIASGLASGRALASAELRHALGIADGEHAVCFIALGSGGHPKPAQPRPAVDEFVRWI